MNSSLPPFLLLKERLEKIKPILEPCPKHYYLSLRNPSTSPSTFLRESSVGKNHPPYPFLDTPPSPSYAVYKHLTWFDPRSGHTRLPTAVGKSATSVEMVIYIRGSLEGESAADEIGRVLRSSRFASGALRVVSPFPLRVHATYTCTCTTRTPPHPTKWHCRKDVSVRESYPRVEEDTTVKPRTERIPRVLRLAIYPGDDFALEVLNTCFFQKVELSFVPFRLENNGEIGAGYNVIQILSLSFFFFFRKCWTLSFWKRLRLLLLIIIKRYW